MSAGCSDGTHPCLASHRWCFHAHGPFVGTSPIPELGYYTNYGAPYAGAIVLDRTGQTGYTTYYDHDATLKPDCRAPWSSALHAAYVPPRAHPERQYGDFTLRPALDFVVL